MSVEDISDRQWQAFHTTYEHRQHALLQNEELGERRLGVLLTVVGAAGVALGLLSDHAEASVVLAVTAVVSALLAGFGFITVARVAQRDVATGHLKLDLYRMRRFIADGHAGLLISFPHMDDAEPHLRKRPLLPQRGGLVEMTGFLTSSFAGVAVLCALRAADAAVVLCVVAGLAAVAASWTALVSAVRAIYTREKCLAPK